MRRTDPSVQTRRDVAVVGRFLVPSVVVGVLAAGVAKEADSGAASWLVVALCLTAALLAAVGTLIWNGYESPPGRIAAVSARRRTDRESGGLQRVERLIMNGLTDLDRFNDRLRPWLIQLARQRLLRTGHVRLDDAEAARPLLGESLWELTQGPRTTVPTPAQLREWVDRIEAL